MDTNQLKQWLYDKTKALCGLLGLSPSSNELDLAVSEMEEASVNGDPLRKALALYQLYLIFEERTSALVTFSADGATYNWNSVHDRVKALIKDQRRVLYGLGYTTTRVQLQTIHRTDPYDSYLTSDLEDSSEY